MTLLIQTNATGAGAGNLDPNQAFVDLVIISNGDTGLGLNTLSGNQQEVTYTRSDPGIPPTRLDNLVNTNFTPNYGAGAQAVDIIILPALANFILNDGTLILDAGGVALPPQNSGLAGAGLNTTNNCLIIYDTTQHNGGGYCAARDGTGGTLDLQTPNPVILYHEMSHAFRIVNNLLLATSIICDPSSPEERSAITDENDLRTQMATATGNNPELRDPGIHCGAVCSGGSTTCCIIASVASGSPLSEEVCSLRSIRDNFLRKSEIGYSLFKALHYDYYGFSPQVCTLMAQYPELRPLVLEGLVRPLVNILHLLQNYSLGNMDEVSLGKQFAENHTDKKQIANCLAILTQAQEVLSGNPLVLTDERLRLANLLSPARSSEYIRWAIIELVEIYHAILLAHFNGCSAEQLGKQISEAFQTWAIRLPLDDTWGILSISELQTEFEMLHKTILRTPKARSEFNDRLLNKYGSITTVASLIKKYEDASRGKK